MWSWRVLCRSQADHQGGFTGLFMARTILCVLLLEWQLHAAVANSDVGCWWGGTAALTLFDTATWPQSTTTVITFFFSHTSFA